MAARSSAIRGLVLDIEGTICPISYVKDILYPYALDAVQIRVSNLKAYFPLGASSTSSKSASAEDQRLLDALAKFPSEHTTSPESLIAHIERLIALDFKDSTLKLVQGILWKDGYASGEIRAPLYKDVIPAIKHYSKSLTHGVTIYSSGSVEAQILLFKHVAGPDGSSIDLTPHLSEYFDTVNAGPKTEAESYELIAKELKTEAQSLLFLSDNPLEIDAATEAGLQTLLTVRPGNVPVSEETIAEKGYKVIKSLEALEEVISEN